MTITDEILIVANTLANEGKKPTVALIKAKLSQQASLPLLISTLKSWQHQPEFIAVKTEQPITNSKSTNEIKESLRENDLVKELIQETLSQELKQMKVELSDIKKLIKELSEQLKISNKS